MNYSKDTKASLRTAALAYRKQLSASDRQLFSTQIIAKLNAYFASRSAPSTSLLLYRAMASEVATDRLFQQSHCHLYAPVTHHHQHMEWLLIKPDTRWHKGLFGVLEPCSGKAWQNEASTTLVCPLTAFDRHGNRLGMGKGCFDYWLSTHRHTLDQVIGLAFSGQEVAQIPAEGHDVPLDCIITEKEVIECPKA